MEEGWMSIEQVLQAVLDRFGFIVITSAFGECPKGAVIPAGFIKDRDGASFGPLVVLELANKEDLVAQQEFVETMTSDIETYIPNGHDYFYKAVAE